MKTIEISVEYLYGSNLVKEVNKFLSEIKHFVKEQQNGRLKEYQLRVKPEFWDLTIEEYMIENLSKTKQKELNKILHRLSKHFIVRNMNRLLHFITKHVTKTFSIYIDKCQKEIEIQNKRKAWLKARNEADALLKDYKEEKGNFYK